MHFYLSRISHAGLLHSYMAVLVLLLKSRIWIHVPPLVTHKQLTNYSYILWTWHTMELKEQWSWVKSMAGDPARTGLAQHSLLWKGVWFTGSGDVTTVACAAFDEMHALKETKLALQASFIMINTHFLCKPVTGISASLSQFKYANDPLWGGGANGNISFRKHVFLTTLKEISWRKRKIKMNRKCTHKWHKQCLYMKTFLYCDTEISNAIGFFTSV